MTWISGMDKTRIWHLDLWVSESLFLPRCWILSIPSSALLFCTPSCLLVPILLFFILPLSSHHAYLLVSGIAFRFSLFAVASLVTSVLLHSHLFLI